MLIHSLSHVHPSLIRFRPCDLKKPQISRSIMKASMTIRDALVQSLPGISINTKTKFNISKISELVVDYQRMRRPPVLVVIQAEEVKKVDPTVLHNLHQQIAQLPCLNFHFFPWWLQVLFKRTSWTPSYDKDHVIRSKVGLVVRLFCKLLFSGSRLTFKPHLRNYPGPRDSFLKGERVVCLCYYRHKRWRPFTRIRWLKIKYRCFK